MSDRILVFLPWTQLRQVQNRCMTLHFEPRKDSWVLPVNTDRALQCVPVLLGDINDHILVAGDLRAIGTLECKVTPVRPFLLER